MLRAVPGLEMVAKNFMGKLLRRRGRMHVCVCCAPRRVRRRCQRRPAHRRARALQPLTHMRQLGGWPRSVCTLLPHGRPKCGPRLLPLPLATAALPAPRAPRAAPAGPVAEQVLLLENVSTSIRVGADQLPSIHRLLTEAATILQMEAPELYVRQHPVPNAYTLAIAGHKPFIVMHTALLELLSPAELQVGARGGGGEGGGRLRPLMACISKRIELCVRSRPIARLAWQPTQRP